MTSWDRNAAHIGQPLSNEVLIRACLIRRKHLSLTLQVHICALQDQNRHINFSQRRAKLFCIPCDEVPVERFANFFQHGKDGCESRILPVWLLVEKHSLEQRFNKGAKADIRNLLVELRLIRRPVLPSAAAIHEDEPTDTPPRPATRLHDDATSHRMADKDRITEIMSYDQISDILTHLLD